MTARPWRIRFNDIAAAYAEQRAGIDAAMAAVLGRGDFIGGQAVADFEEAFARACCARHCIGASSGTTALHLALAVAVGCGGGDDVIVPSMTFIATAEAVSHTGARPVFCDVDKRTYNMTAETAAAAWTPHTRAVVFVHLHGNPTGLAELRDLCAEREVALIEDCAQAHGAVAMLRPRGPQSELVPHPAGSVGRAAAFSFYPGKNLGAFGDAGAVTCQQPEIAERVRRLANHGRESKYVHQEEGYNYRLDTLQAAVLGVKLGALPHQLQRRRAVAARYEAGLRGLPVGVQQVEAGAQSARHLFAITLPDGQRDAVQKALAARGIETGIHYPLPLHAQPAYAQRRDVYAARAAGAFGGADHLAASSLSLPLYPQLPLEQVDEVCEALRDFFRTVAARPLPLLTPPLGWRA